MWKLIVIYMSKYSIIEGDETGCRANFNQCEYTQGVLFAFLYNHKHQLTETYINTIK